MATPRIRTLLRAMRQAAGSAWTREARKHEGHSGDAGGKRKRGDDRIRNCDGGRREQNQNEIGQKNAADHLADIKSIGKRALIEMRAMRLP